MEALNKKIISPKIQKKKSKKALALLFPIYPMDPF